MHLSLAQCLTLIPLLTAVTASPIPTPANGYVLSLSGRDDTGQGSGIDMTAYSDPNCEGYAADFTNMGWNVAYGPIWEVNGGTVTQIASYRLPNAGVFDPAVVQYWAGDAQTVYGRESNAVGGGACYNVRDWTTGNLLLMDFIDVYNGQ